MQDLLDSNPANPKAAAKYPYNYKFKLSTSAELGGNPSCCRVLTITVLVLVSLALPAVALADNLGYLQHSVSIYSWCIYILVFNSVMLLFIPKYFASSLTYPFSNYFVNRN